MDRAKSIILNMPKSVNHHNSIEYFKELYACFTPTDWIEPTVCFPIANFIARHRPDMVDIGTRFAVQVNLFIRTIVEYHDNPKEILDLIGTDLGCFALTESKAGVLSGLIVDTKFTETPDGYTIDTGDISKYWISQGVTASYGLVVASDVSNKRDCRIFLVDMKNQAIQRKPIDKCKVTRVLDVAELTIDKMFVPKHWCLQKTIPLNRTQILDGIFYGRVMIAMVVMNSIRGFVGYVIDKISTIDKFKQPPLLKSHYMYLDKLHADITVFCLKMEADVAGVLHRKDMLKINIYKVYCTETAIQIYNKVNLMFGTHAFGYGLEYETLILNKVAEGDASVLRLAIINQHMKNGYIHVLRNPGLSFVQLANVISHGKTEEGLEYIVECNEEISDRIIGSVVEKIKF